ncbi:hypothetical protein J6590_040753 [Homalodisca vitripennis]|nr:hypothetical protein J6590_040753 [Homalodisca vitripennis]
MARATLPTVTALISEPFLMARKCFFESFIANYYRNELNFHFRYHPARDLYTKSKKMARCIDIKPDDAIQDHGSYSLPVKLMWLDYSSARVIHYPLVFRIQTHTHLL